MITGEAVVSHTVGTANPLVEVNERDFIKLCNINANSHWRLMHVKSSQIESSKSGTIKTYRLQVSGPNNYLVALLHRPVHLSKSLNAGIDHCSNWTCCISQLPYETCSDF